MKRCLKCIMPDAAAGIKLDENGVCQLCKEYKEFIPKGVDELCKEIEGCVSKDAKYNCVVPVSGGRDSAYALYYAKEILGLKPLAVHNDNDFETKIATKNLEKMTKTLNIPLVRVSSKTQVIKKIVAEKFKKNAFFGVGLIVEQTCEACKYGFESASYNTARKEGVKVIIWGDSVDESTVPYHKLFTHKKPTKLQMLLSPGVLNLFKYKYYFKKMKKEYGPNSPDGLKEIHLYDYIKWDRRIIVDTIQSKMGWSAPKESATSWRIDCSLVPLVNYLTEKAYGVSKIEIGFSNMVRGGKMDREDALKQVEQIKKNTNVDELKKFIKQLKIPQTIIDKVL
ncbi:MAG: hypothetical protein L6416_04170 [Candidatus Omnitrophica bacterium]|nr:hypothetical protein [Candidatus Omnitrophota bacterium]